MLCDTSFRFGLGFIVLIGANWVRGDEGNGSAHCSNINADVAWLVAHEKESVHSFLREASRIADTRFLGKSWHEVQIMMRDFPVARSWEKQGTLFCKYLVKKSAFVAPESGGYDLYLLLTVTKIHIAKRPQIDQANAILAATIQKPYAEVVKQHLYPRRTVLEKAFLSDLIREDGNRWPLVNRVEVSYGLLGNRWHEFNPHAFELNVDFGISAEKDIAGQSEHFSFPSGLDPLEDCSGRKQNEKFRPANTLGDLFYWGGSEWWTGTEAEIAANRMKYKIRPKQR